MAKHSNAFKLNCLFSCMQAKISLSRNTNFLKGFRLYCCLLHWTVKGIAVWYCAMNARVLFALETIAPIYQTSAHMQNHPSLHPTVIWSQVERVTINPWTTTTRKRPRVTATRTTFMRRRRVMGIHTTLCRLRILSRWFYLNAWIMLLTPIA